MKKDEKKHKTMKRVSINDVARHAGVSVGTVSRALNSVGYIKKETYDKIIKATAELNYVPNRAGRILKTNQTKMIMLAIPDTSNEVYFEMIESVQKRLKENGYSLLLYYTNGLEEEEIQSVRLLQEKVFDGLILVHFSYNLSLLKEIEKTMSPVVLIGMCNHLWAGKGHKFDTVSIDVYSGIYEAVRYLIKTGHKKIGYLAGPESLEVYKQRFEAYKAALISCGIEFRKEFVLWGDYTEMGGYTSCRILYGQPDRPTAICASNDLQAIGCWEAIRDISDGDFSDVALTGMDNLNISKILGITSINIKEDLMGDEAAKTLLKRLIGEEKAYQDFYFRPELIIRNSSI